MYIDKSAVPNTTQMDATHSNIFQQGYTQFIALGTFTQHCGALSSEDSKHGCVFAPLAQAPQGLRWQGLPRSRERAGSARPSEQGSRCLRWARRDKVLLEHYHPCHSTIIRKVVVDTY